MKIHNQVVLCFFLFNKYFKIEGSSKFTYIK